MIKKIILILLVLVIFFLFVIAVTGCNSNNNSPDYTYAKSYPVPVCDVSFFDNGYALKGAPDENGAVVSSLSLTCYVDYGTKMVVPMCSKPNCNHNNSNCAAAKECSRFIVYNNCFYRLYNLPERNDKGDLILNTQIAKSNLDGTNEKVISTVEGELVGMSTAPHDATMFIYNEKLYIYTAIDEMENQASTNYSKIKLYSISLESGEIKEISTLADGYGINVTLIGATEEKAYFHKIYMENEINAEDYETIEEFLDAMENAPYTEENIVVSLSDGTTATAELPCYDFQHRIFANCYFYSDNEGFYKLNLLDNTTEKIHQHTCDEFYYLFDDYLFFTCEDEEKEYIYNMNDKTAREVPKRTDSALFRPFKIKDGYCYGTASGFSGYEHTSVNVYCVEKDFFKKQNCELKIMEYKG